MQVCVNKEERHQWWSWRSNCWCPLTWEGFGHFQTIWIASLCSEKPGQFSVFPAVDDTSNLAQGQRANWRWLFIMYSTMFGEKKMQHISTNTSLHLLNTVVPEGWLFGPVLKPQDLGTLQSTSWPWTHLCSKCFRVFMQQDNDRTHRSRTPEQKSANWSNIIKKSGPLPPQWCERLIKPYRKLIPSSYCC